MDRKPGKVKSRQDSSQKPHSPYTAKHKLADMLARRDHSPKEIRKKLKDRFETEEIEGAIAWAESKGWIPTDEESFRKFSSRVGEAYHRRKKGIRYINSKLHDMGLPKISSDQGRELEKARLLIENRFLRRKPKENDRARAFRFLMSRGFEAEVVREVVKEFFKTVVQNG